MKKNLLKLGITAALLILTSISAIAAPKPTGYLVGKTVVMSGATGEFGQKVTFALAKQGANIVYVTHNAVKAKELIQQISDQYGVKGDYVDCLITDENQVKNMISTVVAKFGSIDIAINNAGIGPEHSEYPSRPVSELSEKDWDSFMNNSLKGYFFSMKNELAQMQKQGKGIVINTSIEGFKDLEANKSLYYAAKTGVDVITKVAALENKDKGVRVNMVYAESMKDEDKAAETIAWICSDSAKNFTGNSVDVNN